MYARCKNIMDIFCGEKHDQEKKECIKIVKNKTDYTLDIRISLIFTLIVR